MNELHKLRERARNKDRLQELREYAKWRDSLPGLREYVRKSGNLPGMEVLDRIIERVKSRELNEGDLLAHASETLDYIIRCVQSGKFDERDLLIHLLGVFEYWEAHRLGMALRLEVKRRGELAGLADALIKNAIERRDALELHHRKQDKELLESLPPTTKYVQRETVALALWALRRKAATSEIDQEEIDQALDVIERIVKGPPTYRELSNERYGGPFGENAIKKAVQRVRKAMKKVGKSDP